MEHWDLPYPHISAREAKKRKLSAPYEVVLDPAQYRPGEWEKRQGERARLFGGGAENWAYEEGYEVVGFDTEKLGWGKIKIHFWMRKLEGSKRWWWRMDRLWEGAKTIPEFI